VLSDSEIHALTASLLDVTSRVESTGRGGARNLLDLPEIQQLASQPAVRGAAARSLGSECFPVRALLFDKTPTANWLVAWHQDLTIAVETRRDVEGYGPWSVKDGVAHVQPPTSVLQQMVAIRIHLDECGKDNGPLKVLPGSHRIGKLGAEEIEDVRRRINEVVCTVPRGGLLVMRPLLIHASSRAISPAHRRVVHIEYAAGDLTDGLVWRR